MKLLRFMSKRELDKLLAGDVLRNDTEWGKGISKTTSIGFCFFPVGRQAENRELKNKVEYKDGVIYGLKYSIHCNGVSGNDIKD